ncbi:LytTR family two component transcriptional regulator [Christiangramia gaetbulicola]|uniref:LytTR family two component transcriptional regulator n=1 Tax=Christiangramia gaetbulicola TaxID=703340 RepID=A0A2T6ACE8_9FLAO|nr:LytTR family DNA-binding domain-containing protein [Christiangramia gaetbulicola]PTX41487.1 LytTR family two component transcriptional regulator [Christiangramia gaetbulicola]
MKLNENHKPRCLVVDDEPLARDVIRRYIEKLPFLHLVGECSNAIDAFVFLQANEIDILFLDIRMPELLGTELMQSIKEPPKVIFTTAYKEYAWDGFELDAVDYLLKPIRFDRFLKAVNKALPGYENVLLSSETMDSERKSGVDSIYLRIDRRQVRIILDEILYIESAKDYVKIYTNDKMHLCRQTITSIEDIIDKNEFVRIHRSFIVPLNKIRSYTHELVEINKKELPIGKFYLNHFLKIMESRVS